MLLIFHPGDLDWTELLVTSSILVLLAIPFLAFVIWMTAQVVVGFKKDASRKRQRAEKP